MTTQRIAQKIPGELVRLASGSSAGRYRCESPGCPSTLPAAARERENVTGCFYCREYGDGWWNLTVQERKDRAAAAGGN